MRWPPCCIFERRQDAADQGCATAAGGAGARPDRHRGRSLPARGRGRPVAARLPGAAAEPARQRPPAWPASTSHYHLGRSADLADALATLPEALTGPGVVLAGWSLGGALVLNLLGGEHRGLPSVLGAAAICPPCSRSGPSLPSTPRRCWAAPCWRCIGGRCWRCRRRTSRSHCARPPAAPARWWSSRRRSPRRVSATRPMRCSARSTARPPRCRASGCRPSC